MSGISHAWLFAFCHSLVWMKHAIACLHTLGSAHFGEEDVCSVSCSFMFGYEFSFTSSPAVSLPLSLCVCGTMFVYLCVSVSLFLFAGMHACLCLCACLCVCVSVPVPVVSNHVRGHIGSRLTSWDQIDSPPARSWWVGDYTGHTKMGFSTCRWYTWRW